MFKAPPITKYKKTSLDKKKKLCLLFKNQNKSQYLQIYDLHIGNKITEQITIFTIY